MANKLVAHMGLPQSIANLFAARNIQTAKDALSLPEFDLMTLLGVDIKDVRDAVARICEALSLLEEQLMADTSGGHLNTLLTGLDAALGGGIPFGVLTELVGPSGIGKTQFCLKLALIAALPASYGGLDGRVIYIDTESKFSSGRMIEIGRNSFPEIFNSDGMAREMAGRIIVLRRTSMSEITESLQQMKLKLLQHEVKLLVIDSMAALISGENERCGTISGKQQPKCSFSFLKSIAEFSRIPIVVTNQVRGHNNDEISRYSFLAEKDANRDSEKFETHHVAALGIQWAHAVTIRLIFEAHSGQKFIKVAKSPISPPLAFPFRVCSSGITLLSDNGIEMMGQEISMIRCQGHSIL
ncbi:DNA repair protein RAD51 homolog 2 [Phalaenopsis equestris]|uniref:DNA repair protein RAD51 homolog 2 n=1 Tax=Phalaenopsis equestris TaxID=78828 RepID=UPI0009E43C50|nr:DNA repair protein RAD51 homolog 2 [Phalaenopsis equestris]